MTPAELAELVRPLVVEEGFELVECLVSRRQRSHGFKVVVDREDDGVPLEACARISRRVSDVLDLNPVLRDRYQIEVSSPGMNRLVWESQHFRRFQGERVRVKLRDVAEGSVVLFGDIGDTGEDEFELLLENGGSQQIRFEQIEEARLKMDPWKRKPGGKKGKH